MVVRRGEVWWADFGEPRGSEPGGFHPVVVVQADDLNESGIRTAIVAQMTSNLRRAGLPGNVLCKAKESGLPRDSVVVVAHLATLDQSGFREQVGSLPPRLLRELDNGLRLALDL